MPESIPRSHLVKYEPLVHKRMLILTERLAKFLDDGVLTDHLFHLLFNHGFLGVELEFVLESNL